MGSLWTPDDPVTFSLSEVGTDDSQSIDWPSVAPGLRLGSINTTAWNAITPNLTAQLGSTWGQYVQTLDNDAAYLAGIGEPTTDLNQLLSFEIEKANDSYTAQTLTSVTADDLPAPGMDLSFEQSLQQPISGRYTSGILGYGWTTNWDITATTMPNGDVAIDEQRHSLYFSLQPNGTFAPRPATRARPHRKRRGLPARRARRHDVPVQRQRHVEGRPGLARQYASRPLTTPRANSHR